ncbi:XRE family transcriptional regulator [Paenibacillus sp. MDMC362]|nr:XRE family transcriptional regulator [Paenibacillus sp. MDMC362]
MNYNLVNARKELGLSTYEAAQKIGISQSMLSMLETKQRSGSDKTKLKISGFYSKSVEELFYS